MKAMPELPLILKPSRVSASVFQDFMARLQQWPDQIWERYLQGQVPTSHDDVSIGVLQVLDDMGGLDQQDRVSLFRAFSQWQFSLQQNAVFEKGPNEIRVAIPQEDNLLAWLAKHPEAESLRHTMRDRLRTALVHHANPVPLKALGLLQASLMLETGVFDRHELGEVIQAIAIDGMHALQNLWFVDIQKQFPHSTSIGTRRFVLDPLSLLLALRHRKAIQSQLLELPEQDRKKALDKCLLEALRLVMEPKTLRSEFKFSLYQDAARAEALFRLPGFLLMRVRGARESFDLHLSILARNMGVYIPAAPVDMAAFRDDDEQESDTRIDEEADEAEGGKSRSVRANLVSETAFQSFIAWLRTHPGVPAPKRIQLELLCCLGFYGGLRRSEAAYIRSIDVLADAPGLIQIRPYPGHTVKTVSAIRRIYLDWLPTTLQQTILDCVRQHPLSSKSLIELLSGEPFSVTLYETGNQLLQQYFADPTLSLHVLRHSFTSRHLIQLMAAPLRSYEQIGMCSLIDEALPEASVFCQQLLGQEGPSVGGLWALSRAVGHADPSTTLRSYTHIMDLLTFQAYASSRASGYYQSLCQVAGIDNAQLQRQLSKGQMAGDYWRYPNDIRFLGRVPIALLRKAEEKYGGVIRHECPLQVQANPFQGKDWEALVQLFERVRATAGETWPAWLQAQAWFPSFLPSDKQLRFLVAQIGDFPVQHFSTELLEALCQSFNRETGTYSLRKGFPVKELVATLRKSKIPPALLQIKSLRDPLNSRFEELKHLGTLSQTQTTWLLRFRPDDDRRGSHQAFFWYLTAQWVARHKVQSSQDFALNSVSARPLTHKQASSDE